MADYPISAKERARSAQILKLALNGELEQQRRGIVYPTYNDVPKDVNVPLNKKMFDFNRPQYIDQSLEHDPDMYLANKFVIGQNPKIDQKLGSITIGKKNMEDGVLGNVEKSFGGNAVVNYAPSNKYPDSSNEGTLLSSFDTARHEMSHIMGLPDRIGQLKDGSLLQDPLTAYDIDNASHDMHRDIRLPNETLQYDPRIPEYNKPVFQNQARRRR